MTLGGGWTASAAQRCEGCAGRWHISSCTGRRTMAEYNANLSSPLKVSVSVSALRQDNDCQTDRHIAGQRRYQQHSQATGG